MARWISRLPVNLGSRSGIARAAELARLFRGEPVEIEHIQVVLEADLADIVDRDGAFQ